VHRQPKTRPGRSRRRAAFAAVAVVVLWLVAMVAPVAAHEGSAWRLSALSVAPRDVAEGAPVSFGLTYTDRAGEEPGYVRVLVDGAASDMVRGDGTPASGVRYNLSLVPARGRHHVSFAAQAHGSTQVVPAGHIRVGGTSPDPTATPKAEPTTTPKPDPTATPKPDPTATPKAEPTATPKADPTATPKADPTATPKADPAPTAHPTAAPTPAPRASSVPPATPVPPATSGGDRATPRPNAAGEAGRPAGGSTHPRPTSSAAAGGVISAAGGDDGSGGTSAGDGGHAASPAPGDGTAQIIPVRAESTRASLEQGGLSAMIPFSDAFGPRGSPARMIPVAMLTSTATTLAMAFLVFGRRRRDEEPPGSDAELAAAAAAPYSVMPNHLVPAYVGVDPGTGGTDLDLPRWRRPSLLAARKSNPVAEVADPRPRLLFDPEEPSRGPKERQFVRYRIVKLLDQPDELLGNTVGQLDAGDEVDVLEHRGTYRRVLTPEGRTGWVHKMVLGDQPDSERQDGDGADSTDLLAAYLAARARR
jgi:hypothetical protein